jgi:toxin ParE1/3/4
LSVVGKLKGPAQKSRAFLLLRPPEADLLSIGEYTLRKWGEEQTARYLGELEDCCQMLARNPAMGRLSEDIRAGLRHFEHGKHVCSIARTPAES